MLNGSLELGLSFGFSDDSPEGVKLTAGSLSKTGGFVNIFFQAAANRSQKPSYIWKWKRFFAPAHGIELTKRPI